MRLDDPRNTHPTRRLRLRNAGVAAALAFLGGCAGSPPATFYTLSATAAAGPAAIAAHSVAVDAVALPALVDRPQLVLRQDDNRVAIDEQHRWAEPLRNGLGRVVAEDLSRLLAQPQVVAYPHGAGLDPDYRVQVDVQRFELQSRGTATLDAVWMVRTRAGGAAKSGRTQAHEPTGTTLETAVAAMSRAVGTLSADVAAAIRSLPAKRR